MNRLSGIIEKLVEKHAGIHTAVIAELLERVKRDAALLQEIVTFYVKHIVSDPVYARARQKRLAALRPTEEITARYGDSSADLKARKKAQRDAVRNSWLEWQLVDGTRAGDARQADFERSVHTLNEHVAGYEKRISVETAMLEAVKGTEKTFGEALNAKVLKTLEDLKD